MPVKRLKTTTMKKNKKTKTKKQINKHTNKQKKNKSIINTSTNASTIIHSNMDTMYNNNNASNIDSNIDSNILSSNTQMQNHTMNKQNLINLITKISQERKNKTKSQTNLVAKIMRLPSMSSKMSQPKTYAKSVSSYYSSITRNGKSHNKGKKIVNESTKPYLEIDEMQDGQIQHYMLPKNSIPYRESMQDVVPLQEQKIVLDYYPYPYSNQNQNKNKNYKMKTKKTKKVKKTKKNKTNKKTKK